MTRESAERGDVERMSKLSKSLPVFQQTRQLRQHPRVWLKPGILTADEIAGDANQVRFQLQPKLDGLFNEAEADRP